MNDENTMPANAVAVIGMALRVPGARTPKQFWQNLRDGVESVRTLADDELLAAGAAPGEIAQPGHVPAFGVLDGVEDFDARFFGFSRREAQMLDPQHRLLLECAWEALERAGCPSDRTDLVTGVYAGVGENSYLLHNLLGHDGLVERIGAFQTSLGNDKDFVPTRVSYKLDLRGPSVSVQTGCSTSLVAVHMACQALVNGECDIALAGGATVNAAQRRGYRYEPGGVLSPDGHCRPFDAGAAGTVPGSGAGVVVLKRLEEAMANGDRIHAVIRGSAINNDGARKVGFTAPSVDGQSDVIAEALAVADVDPSTVSYVETHGTGTPLGDPIEVAALKSVFSDAGGAHRCALGSVKANIGHLDTAAGVVGLIKAVLALEARELPPTPHFTTPNPELGLSGSPFHVNTARTPWHGEVLRAGVSSFGIGGTNAHVVLEEAPALPTRSADRRVHVLPISAATPTALEATASRLADHLAAHRTERLDDVSRTLQTGRWRLRHRRFVVARDLDEAVRALREPAQARHAAHEGAKDREVVFAFPGQGAQRVRMGQELYAAEPVFRAALDRAAAILEPILGHDIRRLLHPSQAEEAAAREAIDRTEHAQPALFAVEHALAALWMSWGVRPAAMLGHSLGELVAACLAGVVSLEDALHLVAARGRLMQSAPGGAMAAVPLPEADLVPLLGGDLALAAVNGPRQCVVSGPTDAVAAFQAGLADRGIRTKRLRTSHAFHSRAMDDAAAAFEVEASYVKLSPPRVPFVSNVTGTWITAEEATSPAYWARQLLSTVRFDDGLRAVRGSGALVLEVGPGQVLTGFARAAAEGSGAVASLPSAGSGDAESDVLTAVGELWCQGASIAWEALHGGAGARCTTLPTYPFERERCWIEPPRGLAAAPANPDGLSVRSFRRTGPVVPERPASGTWLVVSDRGGVLDDLAERLRGSRPRVVTAPAPEGEDYSRLLASVLAEDERVGGVVVGALSQDAGEDAGGVAERSLSALEHALEARGDGGARLVVVVSGALDVTGEEPLAPWKAPLVTWARAGKPGTRGLIDVVPPATATAARRLTTALAADIDGGSGEPVLALRGGYRFAPAFEPLRAAPHVDASRHAGARYALVGDEPGVAAFGRALSRAGAEVFGPLDAVSPDAPSTAVVVLDPTAARADALALLNRVAAVLDRAQAGAVRGCEVHVLGDSPRADLVEAHVAAVRRDSAIPWTSLAWSRGDQAAIERAAARVVGAAPDAGHVVVAVEDHEDPAAPPEPGGAAEDTPLYEDEVERQIAAIFTDLLGTPRVDPTAGFFELGGHSLLAAQFVAQVRALCGVELPLRAFVGEPTIRGVAAAVRAARSEAGGAPLEVLPTVVPDPASANLPFPLTDVQQAYWIGRTGVFEIGNVGMHGYEEFDIPDVDLPRMQRALRLLIQRHGMLRAVVLPHGEQQILADVPDYTLAVEDLRGLPEDEARAALERIRAELSHQVFTPDRWPLFEFRATVLDGGTTRLHYSIDGLITDARASNVLMRELAALYRDPDAALPPLELSFRDYVLAEKGLESTEAHRRAAAYWRERVPTLALAPELPLARDPRTIDTPRFQRWAGELPEELWSRIKTRAAHRGITPTALLLAVYSEVLATWSKNRRFTLNLPMANRLPLHPEVDAIVGDFTSVTLLEVDAASEVPFEERARAVRDRLVTDIDHRLFSGVRVLREVKKARGDAAAAMPVVFTSLFLDHGQDPQIGEEVYSISQTPQVWIDAQVYEVDGALALDIDAVEALFPEGMVAAMHAASMRLLRWLAEDEGHWSRPVPSLVPHEELVAREAYNRTAGALPPGLLHEPFFAMAAREPERPAVITPGRTISYGELAARARGVAARLRPLGLLPDDLVAVVMEKGWEQCAAVLGILAAGAAYLPIDPELPDERVRFLLDHGRVDAVLTQSRVARAGAARFGQGRTVLRVDELPLDQLSDTAVPEVLTRPDDLAYVIFTSGSTGLPKGVMIDHRGALNTVVDVNERFGVGPEDRVLALSSLSFDLSVYDIFGPLAVGGAVVVPDAGAHRDPAAWLDLMGSAGVTVWNSVPALMELLVEHMSVQGATGTALRLVLLSGDWVPVALPDRIRRVLGDPDVISLGGATEASIWSILHPIGDVPPEWTSIPYGKPMKNQAFHVLDDALRPRATGVPGHLYIGGAGLARGYLHDEEKTAASFITHPVTGERLYRTGDLGRFLPSGEIEFLGREDFQVKVQGYRIELGEIETALAQHPDVRAGVVVVRGEPRGAKRLVAFVVPQGAGGVPEDVRDFLAAKLPGYMVPDVYLGIEALPLTANGKVDRRALVVPEDVADQAAAPPHEAPRTPVEKTVAEVWADMLELDQVGVQDNFFALGGDSLMAMRAVVHLRKAFGIEVPIRVLFDSPTLGDTALVVEDLLIAELEDMSEERAQELLAD